LGITEGGVGGGGGGLPRPRPPAGAPGAPAAGCAPAGVGWPAGCALGCCAGGALGCAAGCAAGAAGAVAGGGVVFDALPHAATISATALAVKNPENRFIHPPLSNAVCPSLSVLIEGVEGRRRRSKVMVPELRLPSKGSRVEGPRRSNEQVRKPLRPSTPFDRPTQSPSTVFELLRLLRLKQINHPCLAPSMSFITLISIA
jgi:hypothetical protein